MKTHQLLTELDNLVEYLSVQLIIRRNLNEINCTFKLFMNILNSIWGKKYLFMLSEQAKLKPKFKLKY